jgi:hypothetical protein
MMGTSFDCTPDVNIDNGRLDCYVDLLLTGELASSGKSGVGGRRKRTTSGLWVVDKR